MNDALKRLQEELRRIGATLPIVSTNVSTRLDGYPRSNERKPDDPGVAVYFQLAGHPHCMPCDTYTEVSDNIAAIAAHIAATRAIERHGVASVSEMFSGFVALPARPHKRPWWEVLGIIRTSSKEQVTAAYRALALKYHPDQPGGSLEKMTELNMARDEAMKAFK